MPFRTAVAGSSPSQPSQWAVTNGRLAEAPLALAEVQGYAYEAALAGAALLDAFGLPDGERWRTFAAGLADRFRARFWVSDQQGPYPAMALDGSGRPVDSVTSNMGHLLATGTLNADETNTVAARLAAPDMSDAYGLRTMSSQSGGFGPLRYHCGAVWPHDTAIAVADLARTGHPEAARPAHRGHPRRGVGLRLPTAGTVGRRRTREHPRTGPVPGRLPATSLVGGSSHRPHDGPDRTGARRPRRPSPPPPDRPTPRRRPHHHRAHHRG